MRRLLFLVLLATAGVANAQGAPDLTPVKCAWGTFTAQQQQALRNSVVIDNSKADAIYYKHDRPTQHETARAATSCKLEYTPAQLDNLSQALGYKAREDVARLGLAARGVIRAHIVDRAVGNMEDDRRAEIGNAFACPNARMDGAWDRSLISAIRRTGTKAVDGPSVAYVGMAMYAIMAQEGFVRRILGTNPPCPPTQ
jgi:hypothetical protein